MAERDPVLARCRAAIGSGSKSFARASWLFDPRIRDAAHLLYAWCRYCDDQIDGQELGHGHQQPGDPEARLRRMRELTRRALDGEAMDQVEFVALQRVVKLFRVPERYPFELLEGFAMDVRRQRFETLDDTLRYCYHVAGVVGLMMAHIMGAHGQAALRRAADLGLAFQLTNIARDVVPDDEVERVYLPLAWLREAGLPVEQPAAPEGRSQLARIVARLLREADRYYASADRGLSHLTLRSAWAVAAARDVYADIGRRVLALGERAWDRRVVVPRRRQLRLVGGAFWKALARHRPSGRGDDPELWSAGLALD